MISGSPQATTRGLYNSMDRGSHPLHTCRSAEEFCSRFEEFVGRSVRQVVEQFVVATEPKAVFLVGSLPLGMATPGSDIDLVVLVDSKTALSEQGSGITNTGQRLAFSNESDSLRAAEFLTVTDAGMLVDTTVVITPSIKRIYTRLRSKGPELSETEILTLSRLGTGWLLWQSEGYLDRNTLALKNSALDVYCCTKYFVSALDLLHKGRKALERLDVPLALNLGRSCVEKAYLAYFASEGFSYLGPKWLAQLGHALGASERVSRQPLLKQNISLLFPSLTSHSEEAVQYFNAVVDFLSWIRSQIEEKTLFRIAFNACPQITAR